MANFTTVQLRYFWVFLIWLNMALSQDSESQGWRFGMNCENGVCRRGQDDGPCMDEYYDRPRLYRWEPIRKGYTREIELEPGKKYTMTTMANKPPIFEIRNFLTPDECEHIKKLAVDRGLHTSITHFDERLLEKKKDLDGHAVGLAANFFNWDRDLDDVITQQEIINYAKNYKFMYFNEEDIENMTKKLDLQELKDDGNITREEFMTLPTARIDAYMNVLKDHHPRHRERYSNQAWIQQGNAADPVIKNLRKRVQRLTRLPDELIRGGEPLQVVHYDKYGHYNGHYDSQSITTNTDYRCCHTTDARPPLCRLCRYATVLYYLNDVEEGGETAFPTADNATYSEEDFTKDFNGDVFNLVYNCKRSGLSVPAEKGKAILWYNHFVDEDTGLLGEKDDFTLHGGCGVQKGEKWVANNWIPGLDLDNIDGISSYDDKPRKPRY